MSHLLPFEEVAKLLKVPVDTLVKIGLRERLPFSITTQLGRVIARRDLPYWRSVVSRSQSDCT